VSEPAGHGVLVVGAGLAAAQTVAELREAGFDGRIRVLGTEGVPPYDRPPLSKHLLDRTDPAWLIDEIGVDLTALADEVRLDAPARALLPGPHPSVLTDEGWVAADDVVLATGAHAVRVPGWEAALTLHTAADAEVLRSTLRPGARLVVIGAGWIGAEVAGVAAASGHAVTVVEAAGAPLSAALGERVGGFTAGWYDEAGIELLTDVRVLAVRPGAVDLEGGRTLAADVVLAAVGARPTTAWLGRSLPLDPDGSVRVDGSYRVLARRSEPDVVPHLWAVGDIARRASSRHGLVPGGHWDGALRGPRVLVGHLLGRPVPAPGDDPAPYVFSTQLGHDLALFGAPGADDEVLLRGDPASGSGWSAIWLARDRATAVLVVDRPRDVGAARRLFTGAELPRVDRVAVADPGLPLRAV
jgi:NADPH-dependent 2,4-dienoyl-CoA reductase/sulfur reductase-like enzyme